MNTASNLTFHNNGIPVTLTPEEVTIKATIGELVESAKGVVILTHADLSDATDLVKAIKQRGKEAEESRTKITGPINESLREINARFKAMTQPLIDAEYSVKVKMIRFQEVEEKRAREENQRREAERQAQMKRDAEEAERQRVADAVAAENRRASEAVEASDPTLDRPQFINEASAISAQVFNSIPTPPPAAPLVEARKTTYGQSGAAFTAKKVWDYELENPGDISQVPSQFLALDTSKVNAAIKAGIRTIPGIKIFEKTVASVR